MGKKTVFTNITPLPPSVTREVAIAMLHDHSEMIELNPLVIEHHPVKTPRDAPKDEFLDCAWHEMTDRISYLPGGMVKGKVTYKACFHDLPNGLQTHVYAPMSLDIREKWTICGTLPGEPEEARELGLNTPRRGLYLREDGEMRCNMLMSSFVRKNLDNSHKVLVDRILAKAERVQTHVNHSASVSETSSVRAGTSNIPPFQPGSHMGNSKLARQMSGTPTATPTSPFRPEQGRFSSESPAVQAARSQLASRDHNIIQELPVTQPGNADGLIQPRSLTDKDPRELHTVHPALREQYRQNSLQTTAPNKSTSRQVPAAGKTFAVELEGSRPETSSSKHSTSSSQRRWPEPVELDSSTSAIPTNQFSSGPSRPSNNTNGYARDGSASAKSTSTDNERQGRTLLPSLSHMRSYSQPMIEANTYIDSASSAHNMEPNSSIISTHPAVKGGRGNSNDNIAIGQGRFRALSNSGTWPQNGPNNDYMDNTPQPNPIPNHKLSQKQPYYSNTNNTLQPNHNYNQTVTNTQTHDPNDPSRFSMVSEISDMPTPKADQFAFGTGQVDSRYSVVSAISDGAPTPKISSGGFADQQRQHARQFQQRQHARQFQQRQHARQFQQTDRDRQREMEWEMQRRNFI